VSSGRPLVLVLSAVLPLFHLTPTGWMAASSMGSAVSQQGTVVQMAGSIETRSFSGMGVLGGVVVSESDRDALVRFSTNGVTDYSVATAVKLSRKWIVIEFPALEPDLPDKLTGGAKIIGEVSAEEAEAGKGVKISVEILPVRIGYEVYQEGGTLVLKVTIQ
jgi:hypothetical protein